MAVVTVPGRPRWKNAVALAMAASTFLAACGGDDDNDGAARDDGRVVDETSTTTTAPLQCGPGTHGDEAADPPEAISGTLDIPEIPGACPVPLVELGLGLAVPIGWDAALVDQGSLDRLAEASLVRPAFLASAQQWSSEGAVFYAAGVSESGEVSDLKIYVEDGVDTSAEGLSALATTLAESGEVAEPSIAGDPADGRVRVDFTVAMPSADDPNIEIAGFGSELLVADGDRLWRFILISESAQAQNALLLVFDSSITFD